MPIQYPLLLQAVAILDGATAKAHGLFFASRTDQTFKTLAGDAGVSKEMRNKLQNTHLCSALPPLRLSARAASGDREVGAYLDLALAAEIKEIGQRELNVVPIDHASALASAVGA